MTTRTRWAIGQRVAAVLAAAAVPTGVGAVRARRAMRGLYPEPLEGPGPAAATASHDPDRPTAVVVLDHAGTEVSDFLLPYHLLAASGAFNVHAAAPEQRPATLTGGLDVVPGITLAGVDALPIERADLIVVPHLPDPDPRTVDWLRTQADAGAVVLSICTGAAVVARTGLLDGREATSHWGDLGRLERRFPRVRWVRGVRYVDVGDVVTSAGITSGVDATLHVIRRFAGDEAMRRAAEAIDYRDLTYLADPTAAQHRVAAPDLILPLTAAFARRRTVGVLLRDGVDETALAAVMDTDAATFTARVLTVTRDGRPVVSRHGLTLLPRSSIGHLTAIDRLLLPGTGYGAVQDALADLAAAEGQPIARFAAKRLEHRTAALPDSAAGWARVSVRLLTAPAAVTAVAALGLVRWRTTSVTRGARDT